MFARDARAGLCVTLVLLCEFGAEKHMCLPGHIHLPFQGLK